MKMNPGETGNHGLFTRIIETSRKMLGQRQTATQEEILSLSALIESEIIPRLQMTFQSHQMTEPAVSESAPRPEYDTEGFVQTLLSVQPDDARAYIDQLRESDHSLLQIYKNLLTPASMMLGELWDDDRVSFADVTIAITKIRHLFIATAPLFPLQRVAEDGSSPSILLTTVPGEQHTFGLHYAVESFRSEGWSVWSGTPRTTSELNDLVSRERYDVTGLSVSATRNLPVVAQAILDVRKHSVNPDMLVILGGQLAFSDDINHDDFKVDLIARDMDQAVADSASMVNSLRNIPL